jgi:two-component system, LytTR family, response regulator
MRETIAAVELRLALSGFVRIHRSALVNAERVKELRPRDKGEYTVVLNDGTELKLTQKLPGVRRTSWSAQTSKPPQRRRHRGLG